ncbi:MAG: hypothetical protein WKG07_02155 [Hymenobacter sp.]
MGYLTGLAGPFPYFHSPQKMMATQTKAAFYTEFGGIDKLQVGTLDLPEVGESDVLLRVKAAGLNPLDYFVREGNYQQACGSRRFRRCRASTWRASSSRSAPACTRLKVGDEVFGMVYSPRGAARHLRRARWSCPKAT